MWKRQLSKAADDEFAGYAVEVNAADRAGLSAEDRCEAAKHDNERVREWLAKQHLSDEWAWEPPARDGLALAIIARFERHYRSFGNPAFVWAARQIARELLPYLPKDDPGLRWVEAYVDATTDRMAVLVNDPPKEDVNGRIAEALGFDSSPGRGQGSPFSSARRVIRDGRLAAEVLARLPHEGGKEGRAIAYVADKNELKKTTVGNAFRSLKTNTN